MFGAYPTRTNPALPCPSKYPPTELLIPDSTPRAAPSGSANADATAAILAAQATFYKALSTGDTEAMKAVWVDEAGATLRPEVSEVEAQGGRLDR